MAQVFLISDWAAVESLSDVPDSAIRLSPLIYLFATGAVALVGLMVGSVELLYLSRRLTRYSLGMKLLLKTLLYSFLLFVVILITFPIAASIEMGIGPFDPRVWDRFDAFLTSRTSIGTAVQLGASLVISLFYAEISEHMGPGVLRNFLTGRYHRPREERRIFLFTDMKDSTAIAEHLGHTVYFDLLKAYYDVLSDAIVRHGGEVYQYIGDEIVVSWTALEGARNGACIQAARAMLHALDEHSTDFEERFGVRPSFRAGLQLGLVTTGEIGALKKEIVFTGDVLNQTARIQQLCKSHDVDVLLGGELVEWLLQHDPDMSGQFESLGEHTLRGRSQAVELYRFS